MLAGNGQPPLVLALDTSILLPGLLLAAGLLVAAAVIALASSWRKRTGTPASQTSDLLAEYRQLYEQGVISQEEYDRLRAHLGGQLCGALNVPAKPAEAKPGTPDPGDNPPAGPPAGPAPASGGEGEGGLRPA